VQFDLKDDDAEQKNERVKAQATHEHRAKEHAQHADINRVPAHPIGAVGT
jgi:hypothetical protein